MTNQRQHTIAVLSTNIDGIILSWNNGMELATGIKASHAINKNIFHLSKTFETADIGVRLKNVLSHGTTEYLSSRFHPSLNLFFKNLTGCHITVTPLRQSDNSIIGMLIIAESNSENSKVKNGSAKTNETEAKPIDLSVLIHELVNNHRNPTILSSIIEAFKRNDRDFINIAQELTKSTDHEVRMYTAQILGTLSTPKASKILVKLLEDENPNVQYHAIEALGKSKDIKVIPKLERLALAGDFFLASAAIDALINIDAGLSTYNKLRKLYDQPEFTFAGIEMAGRILHPTPFKDLCNWLNSSDFVFQAASTISKWIKEYGLEQFADSIYHQMLNDSINDKGIDNLTNLLDTDDDKLLKQVITLIVFIKNTIIQKKLVNLLGNQNIQEEIVETTVASGCNCIELLKEKLKETNNKEIQKVIAILLGRIGNESVLPELCDLLGKDDELTLISAGAMAKIGSKNAYPFLMKFIGTPSPIVRRAIISALNSISHPDMPNDLKNYILSPDPYTQESAIRIAGYFGYPQYKKSIVDAVNSPMTNVAIAAVEVLPFFDGIDDIKNLFLKSIERNDVRIKIAVAKSIAFLDSNDAQELISELLGDKDPWVRNYTIRSIIGLRILSFKDELKSIAKNSNEVVFVRLAAILALGELNLVSPKFFVPFTHDSNLDIAQTAIHALSLNESAEAQKILIGLLNGNHKAEIRLEAASALANYDTHESSKTLFEHVQDLDRNVAIKCVQSLGLHNNRYAYGYLLELCFDIRVGENARKILINKRQHYLEELLYFLDKGFEHKMLLLSMMHQIDLPGKEEILFQLKSDKNARVRQGAKTLLDSLMLNI
ncbi:HEAT repeat domain-containing protein [Tenuifilum thalassicum]|uniref:PAS domain-containing protein n=1 Tax=Tenuifilum thalassicum TaxID=2590900 RepID=A0A7D3XZL9_9BACT|nr:HEAT repeat domain-containing protein [Tenuifilum thalassicum]QKG79953.1 hypothetical protein FHG85_06635 [Tenuifilum thalassicum]